MALPTLRQLQYFIAIAECQSVTDAADQCHITQSALSSALAELETLFGEKLFDRSTRRKITLTAFGKDLLPKAKLLIEDAENMMHMASRNRAPLTGKLALGVIPTIAPYLLPQLLPALQDAYPELDLMLKEDITGRQLDNLKNGLCDVVLMAFPYDTPSAETMLLWSEPFFLARAGKLNTTTPALTLNDLEEDNILLLDDGHCLRDHVISACRLSSAVGKQKTLGATSLQTLIQMVQHGYGTTLLPAMALKGGQLPKGLNIQRFANPQPVRKIGLAWRKGDPRGEEFRLLGRFIKKIGYIKPEPQ